MIWVKPQYSRKEVKRAGETLANPASSPYEQAKALLILDNWRAAHGYPINTFQATLRAKLKGIDATAIVAQRLKRIPSIITKLRRFPEMNLARMQDIVGIRAIVGSMSKARDLESNYRKTNFAHQLTYEKDYITHPKDSGYRSIHLVYKYSKNANIAYDGLSVELQIRTRLQHAWATAVETMGTAMDYALKSSLGPKEYLDFFSIVSSAFSFSENCPVVTAHQNLTKKEIFELVKEREKELGVRHRLRGFAVAIDHITQRRTKSAYNLITLNLQTMRLSVTPFSKSDLDRGMEAYLNIEREIASGQPFQAVLVSAGSIDSLKRAYPNYFMDTNEFIKYLDRILNSK